jgi:hypothetical protein
MTVMVEEVFRDTDADILGTILEQVQALRESMEERIKALEDGFTVMSTNIDILVEGYQDHNQRFGLQDKAIARGTPKQFSIVRGGEEDGR